MITMGIQINGKTKTTIEVPAEIEKDEFMAQVKADKKVIAALDGKTIVKEIYVPGKICNLVIQ
jgi:leucyl-tRNA synthetase